MTPNRIVALLTPLVFAPLAGAVAAWLADNVPGTNVPQSALQEIFIAGALIALAPAAQWLHGWQKFEARQAAEAQAAEHAAASEPVADETDFEEPPEPDALDELDDPMLLDDLEGLDDELFADERQPEPVGV